VHCILLSLQRCRTNTTKLLARVNKHKQKVWLHTCSAVESKRLIEPAFFSESVTTPWVLEICKCRSWHPHTVAALQGFLFCLVALHFGMLLHISVNEQLVQQKALCLLYLDQKRTGDRTYLRTSLVSCCQHNGITIDYSNQTCKTRVYQSQTYIKCKPYQLRSKLYHCLMRSQNCEKRLLVSPCPTSVRPSERPNTTIRLPVDRFSSSSILEYFSKICRDISSLIKIWQK
jgi:hypothetical protein